MAKLETLFGVARGSIGKVTLRKRTTSTGTRAMTASQKVTSETMTNPKTYAQCEQRARFATAVKFYKRATKNFFRFAYEDKKANESDYNAFMRHNIGAALPMNRYQLDAPAYLAIGAPWLLTQGSLSIPVLEYDTADAFRLSLSGAESGAGDTVGYVSGLLIDNGYAQAGDIITVVLVGSNVRLADYKAKTKEDVAKVIAAGATVPEWTIAQFIVNADDTTSLNDVKMTAKDNLSIKVGSNGESDYLSVVDINGYSAKAAAFIVSRKETSGLLVSTNYLVPDTALEKIIEYVQTSEYYTAMFDSWRANDETAILEGSIADGTRSGSDSGTTSVTGAPSISTLNGKAVPVDLGTLTAGETSIPVVGSKFQSEDYPLQQSQFSIAVTPSTRATITGLEVRSNTSALLKITTAEGNNAVPFTVTWKNPETSESVTVATGNAPGSDA